MMYCAECGSALLERTVSESKVLLCSSCGALYVQKSSASRTYRYAGTMHGNQQLRELLSFIDKEERNDEALALKTNSGP